MTAPGLAGQAAGAHGTAGPSDTGVYLYGVARGLDPAALGDTTGVAGAPVRGVAAAGLTDRKSVV